jgi:hypothetical protein
MNTGVASQIPKDTPGASAAHGAAIPALLSS